LLLQVHAAGIDAGASGVARISLILAPALENRSPVARRDALAASRWRHRPRGSDVARFSTARTPGPELLEPPTRLLLQFTLQVSTPGRAALEKFSSALALG